MILNMRLIFRIIKDNIIRLLFALIGMSVVSTICLLSFVDLERKTAVYDSLYSFLPSDSIIIKFNNNSMSDVDEKRIELLTSEVALFPEVDILVPFCPQTVYLKDDASQDIYCFQMYNSEISSAFRFDIKEGRAPAKGTNEVLVSQDAARRYRIGDEIHTKVVDWSMNDARDHIIEEYFQSVDLTVVGIVEDTSRFISLDSSDATPLGLIEARVSEYSEAGTPLVFSYGSKDIEGNPIDHKYESDLVYTLVVKLKDGVPSSEAISHIYEHIQGYGFIKTGREFVEEAIESQWKDYRPIIGVGLAALFIMTITLISIYLFQIKKGMKALISYYICGCSWNRIILSLCLINVPTTILGLLFGIIYFRNSTALFEDVVLTKTALISTVLLIVLIQAVISILFFLSLHRVSPVDIRRKENE